MEASCKTSYCLKVDGFPKLLRLCTARLGIQRRPEYDGREFVEHGIEKCVVTVHIGASPHYDEWRISGTGHRFSNTCQVVARKALRALCQIYEVEVADTPLRFFPPWQRNRPIWLARMQTLEGQHQCEDDPTMVYLTAYLLTLDTRYDALALQHKRIIARAEEADVTNRKLHVELTAAQAHIAALESHEVIAVEALKQAEDEHLRYLLHAYLNP